MPLLFQKLYSNKADLNDIPCKTNIKKRTMDKAYSFLSSPRSVCVLTASPSRQLGGLLGLDTVYHVIYRIERDINGNGSIRCDVIARRILSETKASSPLPR